MKMRGPMCKRSLVRGLCGAICLAVLMAASVAFAIPLGVYADAGTVSGKIMELKEGVTIYADKSADSEVLVTFKAGDVIFVTGDTGDGWYTVAYQGKTGYLSGTIGGGGGSASAAVGTDGTAGTHELELETFAEADPEALDNELKQLNVESTYLAEEVEQYKKNNRNAIIWVAVIAVIAIALIVVGILSYRKKLTEADTREAATEDKDRNKNTTETEIKADIIDLDKEEI